MDQGFNGFSIVIYEGNTTCRPDQFKCDNRECIYISLKCDGYIDCMDGSDEASCCKYIYLFCFKMNGFEYLGAINSSFTPIKIL